MGYIPWEQLISLWTVQIQFWGALCSALSLAVTFWTKKK